MSKYVSIFFLVLLASAFTFFPLALLFDGGDYAETAIYIFGTLIVILLSFLIAQMYYLINLVKCKR